MRIKFNGAIIELNADLTTLLVYSNRIEVKTAEVERLNEFLNIATIEEVNFKTEKGEDGNYIILEVPTLWVEEVNFF